MALKIISFICIVSFAFGITAPNQIKDLPFDVNDIINRVSPHYSRTLKTPTSPSDLTGEFLVDTTIVYVGAPNEQVSSAIAFDGTNYLVVWQDNRSGSSDIYGAMVSQNGLIFEKMSFAISNAMYNEESPDVAFDGTNYLVVWTDRRNSSLDIYGARISQDGTVLDTAGIPLITYEHSQFNPAITFDGTNYLLVWQDNRSGSYYEIYGARISQTGAVLDPNGFTISPTTYNQEYPAIAFDGTNYLVIWQDGRSGSSSDIYGARITQNGTVLDSERIAISTATNDQQYPAINFGGTNYLVVWQDCSSYVYDIYGTRVSEAGIVLDPDGIAISTATGDQLSPAIAFDNTNYLVVWQENRSYYPDVYAARISQLGVVLDSNGFAISNDSNSQEFPTLAFDGNTYLVVWQDNRSISSNDIYGARVSQTGTILDPNGLVISTVANTQETPALAFDGTNYLVVWTDERNGIYEYDIYGARITQTGDLLDSFGFAISTAVLDQESPAVAFDGTNYLVVWTDERNGIYSDIYGARVSQNGTVLDTNGFAISTDIYGQYFPTIAFDGTNYLVVWHDERNGVHAYDIYGARVSQAGNVLDPNGIAISTALNRQGFPAIAFDGINYLIVWRDERNGANNSDIYGTRVSQTGIVIDTNGIAISGAEYSQWNPSVAFDGTNYLVVWEDYRWGGYVPDIYGAFVSQTGSVLDPYGIVIWNTVFYQESPVIVFDGTNYLVVWEDNFTDSSDLYGAKINIYGVLVDSLLVSNQEGCQGAALAHGSGNQILITYQGWVGEYHGKAYDATRIWGKFYPFVPSIAKENSNVKIQSAKLLEVYPNPARSFLAVRLPQTADRQMIRIFDVSGTLVKEEKVTGAQSHKQEMIISLKGINPGIYFLQVGKEVKKFLVVK
jgi:predicted nucleic-acid-binding Zn-ribbon protein